MTDDVIASGTVRVKNLDPGGPDEWDEIVEVFERDLEDTDGSELTPEDVARRVARHQAEPFDVETLEVDIA